MDAAHQDLILDQFTRQASPFSAAPMITDEIPLRMIVEAAQATSDDIILDVACALRPIRNAHDIGLHDVRMLQQDLLDLARRDIDAAGLDHLL
jgi:hypothetical protein